MSNVRNHGVPDLPPGEEEMILDLNRGWQLSLTCLDGKDHDTDWDVLDREGMYVCVLCEEPLCSVIIEGETVPGVLATVHRFVIHEEPW